jgi:hypothetical protein
MTIDGVDVPAALVLAECAPFDTSLGRPSDARFHSNICLAGLRQILTAKFAASATRGRYLQRAVLQLRTLARACTLGLLPTWRPFIKAPLRGKQYAGITSETAYTRLQPIRGPSRPHRMAICDLLHTMQMH